MLYLLVSSIIVIFLVAFATQAAPWWATASFESAAAAAAFFGYLWKRSRESRRDQRIREATGKFYRSLKADPKATAEALGGGVATVLWTVLDGAGVKIQKKAKAAIKEMFHEDEPLVATLKALLAIATGKLELSKAEQGQLVKNAEQVVAQRPAESRKDIFGTESLQAGYKIVTGEGAVSQQFGAMKDGEKAFLIVYPKKAWVERYSYSFFSHNWQWVEEEIMATRISVNPRLILESFKGDFVEFITGYFPQFKLVNGGVVQDSLFINEWENANAQKVREQFEKFVGVLEARLAANK